MSKETIGLVRYTTSARTPSEDSEQPDDRSDPSHQSGNQGTFFLLRCTLRCSMRAWIRAKKEFPPSQSSSLFF